MNEQKEVDLIRNRQKRERTAILSVERRPWRSLPKHRACNHQKKMKEE